MSDATLHFRAHFDGKVIVPDEPVDLPLNEPLEMDIRTKATDGPDNRAAIEKRLAAFNSFVALAVPDANIPIELLRREHLYGDDGR